MKDVIELSIEVKAPFLELWHALTDPDELENWWGEGVKIEPKVGGKFQEKWEDDEGKPQLASGKVLALKKGQEITFTWREKTWPPSSQTECTFVIQEKSKSQSILKVRHTGWQTLPSDLKAQALKDFKVGWTYHLKELKSYLDE